MALTPWLSDLVAAVAAPTQVWCGRDGDVDGRRGAEGVWHGDVRVLRTALLTIDGETPTALLTAVDGPDSLRARGVARGVSDSVRVDRRRVVEAQGVQELISITAPSPVRVEVLVTLTSDLAPMDAVRGGRPTRPVTPAPEGRWAGDGVTGDGVTVEVTAPSARREVSGEELQLSWTADVAPGRPWTGAWTVVAHDAAAVVVGPPDRARWASRAEVATSDPRLQRWVARALADLDALRMAPVEQPADVFVAAGAPWYFTLFGRDSLWTARLALPLGWELAASTLRVLAARQGGRHDPATAEAPGKILHELRRGSARHGDMVLPPVYYGTVDATSLWICLLHEAWRAGMPEDQVERLLPNLEAALAWQTSFGDEFLHYVDESGTGLSNQGWKDSDDSVQWNDGRLAQAPIALCEVQGYAYQAAIAGAELMERFGRAAGPLREWAQRLRARFRTEFWVHPSGGLSPESFPAIAVDAEGRAVDSLTSNLGHLLGTGLLDADEAAVVAGHLASPSLSSGFGLRTLSSDASGFDPLSYHCGAVWTHDTAIAIVGLAREGFPAEAGVLLEGLLQAVDVFDHRVPELHGGDAREDVPAPVPYPASCRPQAWSAAAAVAVLGVCVEHGGGVLPSATFTLRPAPS